MKETNFSDVPERVKESSVVLVARSMPHVALLSYGATEIGASQFSADLLWRTAFRVPDPFPLIEIEGRTFFIVSSLESGRARKEARVDEVVPLDVYRSGAENPTIASAVIAFLREKKVGKIFVSDNFPHGFAKALAEASIEIETRSGSLYPARARKTQEELLYIRGTLSATEAAIQKARAFLESCTIKGAMLYAGGAPATSERIRKLIEDELYGRGCLAVSTIVSCGTQSADPHCVGSGILAPHVPIVIDVFPLSLHTRYWADMTRTFVKGEPSKELRDMYEAVHEAQERGIREVRPGVDGFAIYELVKNLFDERGYPTSGSASPEGFIHGVGHGVGIELHEAPRIGAIHETLQEGNVVTVEPGLYYSRARDHIPQGGIRIEDMVVVEQDGCKLLTTLPKTLDWAVV